MKLQSYRFEILSNGQVTPDTLRIVGRSEQDARAKSVNHTELNPTETLGKLIHVYQNSNGEVNA